MGGNPFAGVMLPGSDGADLQQEIDDAIAALHRSRLVTKTRGFGLAPMHEQTAALAKARAGMNVARPVDWQQAPTKAEWKALAKVYVQRRRAGESAEGLVVLEEALRCSGCKAAVRILDDDVEGPTTEQEPAAIEQPE